MQTYDRGFGPGTGANREDLLDVMYNVDPQMTPFVTQIAGVKTGYASTHEWVEDTLPVALTTGHEQGADFSEEVLTIPQRRQNYMQIFRWDMKVALSQIAVRTAGVPGDNDYEYEVVKSLKAIRIALEKKCFAASGASTTGEPATGGSATLMKTLCDFIALTGGSPTGHAYSATDTAIGGPGGTAGVPVTGTTGEAIFNGLLEKIYTSADAEPADVMLSPNTKRAFSTYTGVANARHVIALKEQKVYNAVDYYDSDFGTLRFWSNKFVPQAALTAASAGTVDGGVSGYFVLDRRYVDIVHLRNRRPRHYPLAAAGDAVRGYVACESTLKVATQIAHGRVYGITTTW
jgi:hypothetical protein